MEEELALRGVIRQQRPDWFKLYKVVNPLPGRWVQGWALQEYPFGLLLHFNVRDALCTQGEDCVLCRRELPRRWKGFLPAITADQRTKFILPLTEEADEQLHKIREIHGHVKHQLLRLDRTGHTNNSPVLLTRPEPPALVPYLPDTFDPRASVLVLHGFDVGAAVAVIDRWNRNRPNTGRN